MSSAALSTTILAQAMAEYVVSTLARAGTVLSSAAGAGWSFVSAHPWEFGAGFLLLVIFLARR